MKRFLPMLIFICIFGLLLQIPAGAQGSGPEVDILGPPDSASTPPDVNAYVSVVDPASGRFIDGLGDGNFSVQVSGEDVVPTISTETAGVAVAIVIDRGGIARRGDARIGDVVGLAQGLLDRLNVDGSATADMVGLIGIRGRDSGGLTPLVPFTDFDPNAVRNELDVLPSEAVGEVTPLYDGIDRALAWLTENPDDATQEKVAQRRRVIVVFSDGIDNQFSNEAHETIIINKCVDNGILLYAVRMAGGATDADNLEALAVQTSGIYVTHTSETRAEVDVLFDDIVTQRNAYRLTFPLLRRQGDYSFRVRVLGTPVGDGSDEGEVSSRLLLPEIALLSPDEGAAFTIPYSRTLDGYLPVEIPLRVEIVPRDGIARAPAEVTYFANGVPVGTSTAAPSFDFVWDVGGVVTPTREEEAREYILTAAATDPYLDESFESPGVDARVTWEAVEPTPQERIRDWLMAYWWLLIIFVLFALGLLVLLVLLIRTQGKLAKRVANQTTGAIQSFTRRLSAAPSKAPGKLVVIQGVNTGREYRLDTSMVKVGRDPQFSDFPLYDEYASNPHFSIRMERMRFYLTDEGSTNGTSINGMPIRSHQPILLQPDAIIEVGKTKLQFKRLGGATRQLGAGERQPRTSQRPRGGPTDRAM